MRNADLFAVIWFAAFNLATFIAFAFDKRRAARSGWRVSEFVLVSLGALGGWPGGWVAMNLFRHKTVKWTFQFKYALGVIPFAVEVWMWLHWR